MNRTALAAAVLLVLSTTSALAGGSFTYRGQLDAEGAPAQGRYGLEFTLFADPAGTRPLASPVVQEGIEVVDGGFAVAVEFPDLPGGSQKGWLRLAVREADAGAFVALPALQPVSLSSQMCPQGWALTGNAATDAALNFIGTTDDRTLTLRANNQRVAQFHTLALPDPQVGFTANVVLGSPANAIVDGALGAAISGGGGEAANIVADNYGVVGGGSGNRAGNEDGTPGNASYPTIAGGFENVASQMFATVGGGGRNLAQGAGAFVGGGWGNVADAIQAAVGGGTLNEASGFWSTIGGGAGNVASAQTSSVGGGMTNTASGQSSAIGGGVSNEATGQQSTIAGGSGNVASGLNSTVGGGLNNSANGNGSVVAGGILNCAGAAHSWAGGHRAKVRPGTDMSAGTGCALVPTNGEAGDWGTFVWADGQITPFVSSGANQFLVRASGGALITGGTENDPAGNRLRVDGTLRVDTLGAAGVTTLCRNALNQLAACSSSARYKHAITDLDLGLAVAERLRAVAYRWNGSEDADIGFVAEEVAAIDPRLVTYDEHNHVEGVKYERLTAVLANATHELATKVRQMDADHAALAASLASLQGEHQSLRERLVDLDRIHRHTLAERASQDAEIEAIRHELAQLRALMVPAVAGGR